MLVAVQIFNDLTPFSRTSLIRSRPLAYSGHLCFEEREQPTTLNFPIKSSFLSFIFTAVHVRQARRRRGSHSSRLPLQNEKEAQTKVNQHGGQSGKWTTFEETQPRRKLFSSNERRTEPSESDRKNVVALRLPEKTLKWLNYSSWHVKVNNCNVVS